MSTIFLEHVGGGDPSPGVSTKLSCSEEQVHQNVAVDIFAGNQVYYLRNFSKNCPTKIPHSLLCNTT